MHSSAASYPPVHILRLVRHPEKFQRHLFLEMFFEMEKIFNTTHYKGTIILVVVVIQTLKLTTKQCLIYKYNTK